MDGKVDPDIINAVIAKTPLFAPPEEEQEWQTVWWALHREPEDIITAFDAMIRKVDNLEYHDPGIILHVFSVWLNAVDMGLADKSYEGVEKRCRQYIDDIAASGNLQAGDGLPDGYGHDRKSYYDFDYPHEHDPNSQAFQELFDHMRKTQDRRFQASFPALCDSLLNKMETDVEAALNLLSEDRKPSNPYYRQPVLAHIDISRFVEVLLGLPSEQQISIYRALQNRYKQGWPELEVELGWLEALVTALQSEVGTLSTLSQWQLKKRTNIFLSPYLSEQPLADDP